MAPARLPRCDAGQDAEHVAAGPSTHGSAVCVAARGRRVAVTCSIVLRPDDVAGIARTQVLLRLRMAPIRRVWLARTAGEFLDAITIAGMAAGLRERLLC